MSAPCTFDRLFIDVVLSAFNCFISEHYKLHFYTLLHRCWWYFHTWTKKYFKGIFVIDGDVISWCGIIITDGYKKIIIRFVFEHHYQRIIMSILPFVIISCWSRGITLLTHICSYMKMILFSRGLVSSACGFFDG